MQEQDHRLKQLTARIYTVIINTTTDDDWKVSTQLLSYRKKVSELEGSVLDTYSHLAGMIADLEGIVNRRNKFNI